jgi:hypothetical protein
MDDDPCEEADEPQETEAQEAEAETAAKARWRTPVTADL